MLGEQLNKKRNFLRGSFASIFAPDDHNIQENLLSSPEDSSISSLSKDSCAHSNIMRHSTSTSVLEMGNSLNDWRQSVNKPLTYRIGSSTIRFQKPLIVAFAVIAVAVLLLFFLIFNGGSRSHTRHFEDHKHVLEGDPFYKGYNRTYPLSQPVITPQGMRYRIGVITDLDTDSKVQDQQLWKSYLKLGYLYIDDNEAVDIQWDRQEELNQVASAISSGGRGMELSELVVFDGKLLSIDDRTGIVYQIKGTKVYPWVILADGNGLESKGFKGEWMTVKDNHLYVGGLGKEWTTSTGEILNFNPMYVKKISNTGQVEHLNWHDRYVALRTKVDITYPGYMIHEAVAWSQAKKKWFLLPRRASKFKYNDVEDENRGTNMMFIVDEDFSHIDLKLIGNLDQPSHGFSSFKFVPGTHDDIIVALKSQELAGTIASYIMVFKTDGTILYPETKIGSLKYEGIEFL